MSRHATRHNKRDENEPELLKVLEQLGIDWEEAGPLDGWIYLGEWIPVEFKMPGETLTDGQRDFIEDCNRLARPYFVWRTVDQITQELKAKEVIA